MIPPVMTKGGGNIFRPKAASAQPFEVRDAVPAYRTLLFHRSVSDRSDKPAVPDDFLHELGERGSIVHFSRSEVADDTVVEIGLDYIALTYLLRRLGTLNYREPDVDSIAVEDTREALCNDERDPARLNGYRSVLARGTAPEIQPCGDDVALFNTCSEGLVEVLHAVSGELRRLARIEVPRGYDNVCIDVVAVFYHITRIFHAITSHGEVILPVSALAAAVAGLARYTSDFGWPIRPTKFRFVVVTARSPSARMPI